MEKKDYVKKKDLSKALLFTLLPVLLIIINYLYYTGLRMIDYLLIPERLFMIGSLFFTLAFCSILLSVYYWIKALN